MQPAQTKREGNVGVVGMRSGIVIAVSAADACVIHCLTAKSNASVISASRTQQLLNGSLTPAEMTDVVSGMATDRGLAQDLANRIDPNAILDSAGIIPPGGERREPKKVTKRKTAAQRAAEAAAAGDQDNTALPPEPDTLEVDA